MSPNILDINTLIILGICLLSWFGFLRLTRGVVTMIGPNSPDGLAGGDNGNLIRVTAKSREWKWPSDMHTKTYSGTSTSQRDITVLLLVLFQKIFRDRKSEYPILALWSFAHIVSVFILYLIGSYYWGSNIGLLVSLLYLSSFWIWQMSLWVGHLNVGTMFFLLSVYLLTTITNNPGMAILLLFMAGSSLCCMIFSSSSSLKYAPLFFTALFFTKHQITGNDISLLGFYKTIADSQSFLFSIVITLILISLLFIISIFRNKLIKAIYERRAWVLNNLISAKKYELDHYLKTGKQKLNSILKFLIKPYAFLFFTSNAVGLGYFVPVILGFLVIVLILILPDMKKNLTFYFNYLYISYIKPGVNSGLVRYVRYGYFDRNNIPIPSNLRGGGLMWVPKIFFKMAPWHTLVYIGLLLLIILTARLDYPILILLVFISLLPTIWAEATKAYQVSRSYSAGLLGFMILIGVGSFLLKDYQYFNYIAIFMLFIIFSWNVWKFFTVIYPARMSFNKIIKKIKSLNLNEIYTYNTFYNDSFLYNLSLVSSINIKINFIKSVGEVKNGWILIPPTTHKAGYIRQEESIQGGDYTDDPTLNGLLETRHIDKIAESKFQTVYGSDDIWLQENDITSYLDLILHFITQKDHFRGYAWLLHSDKIKVVPIK